jgi:hypothetical protein
MFEKKTIQNRKKTEGMGEKCFKFFVTKLSIKNTKRKKERRKCYSLCVSVIFEGKKRERKNEKSLLRHPPLKHKMSLSPPTGHQFSGNFEAAILAL